MTQQTEIFEVENLLSHPFILKVLYSTDSKQNELFQREYVVLSVLNHPNIPRVDVDDYFPISTPTGQNLQCLVMERIEGETLEQWSLSNGRVSERVALTWMKQVVAPSNDLNPIPGVLAYLHQNRIVHRDLKPSNFILKPSGDIALIDFGSVREIQPDQARQENSRHRNPTIVSSAGYSPPEQFNGQAMFTSDFYALGRTWVQLLTGQMPLDLIELTTNRLRWHHLTQISKPFAKWLDTLMSISPERRPASTEIIHEDLTTRLPRQIRRSRVVNSWAFKGIVTAAAIAALIGISAKYTDWKANEHLQQGTKNLQAGYYPLARTEFEAAVQANDRSSVAHNNLGLACYYLADDACAVQHYERAISLDATNWEAHNNLAALYDRQGRYDLAASQYLIAANGPNDLKAQAISNLARLKNLQGQYKEAESLVHSVLGLTQVRVSLAALYKNLGWALFGVKHYSEAQAALEQARAFDGSRVDTYCLLALVRSAQKLDANNEAKACLFSVSSLPLPEVQEWRNQIEKARI